jgi:glycosyltransferase involved in cell wall biosynthesis
MYSELNNENILFFSPADNSLPRHFHISFWMIRFIKQVGVSIWLHFNALRIIARNHLDGLNVHSGAGGVLLVRHVPVPVIITCHHTYRQQYHYIKSQFWKRIFLPFEKRTYRLATRIICVSEDTKRDLLEHYDIPEKKISVIYNAVDTNRFHPLGIAKTPHSLLYVGRIDKRKGIEFLIRSMPLVLRQIPDAQLLVGGKGGYLEKMKSLVSRLGLERNVTFLGFVPDDQLNALYNKAQCVVVPSIFEGFGITAIEAIAAGTRVVGTDVDGIREILKSGEYGRLAPYGNHHALAEAIAAELRHPESVQALRPEYQVAQFKDRYLKVLEETSTPGTPPGPNTCLTPFGKNWMGDSNSRRSSATPVGSCSKRSCAWPWGFSSTSG